MTKQKTEVYREGFSFREFKFAFKNEKLFRLPSIKNGRSYPFKEVPLIKLSKTGEGFRLCRQKKSILQVRAMVQKVNWKIKEQCKQCK